MSLGRGLGALITSTNTNRKQTILATGPASAAGEKAWSIPLKDIEPDPKQPRRTFAPEQLQELANSIKQFGILQPILVSEKDSGGYEVIAGERRYRAAKLAGLVTIPALVKKFVDLEKLE